MGWLSAIGAGGQQGLDRYSQWRQLDQKNQWEEQDRKRQAMLDAAAEKDRELQARATRQAILKNQIGMTAPGTALKPEQVAEYEAEGLGGLFGEGGVFKGTYEQNEAKRSADMAQALHDLQVKAAQGKQADDERNRGAQTAYDNWMKTSWQGATPEQMMQKIQEFGVTQMNPATEMLINAKMQERLAGIQASRNTQQAAAQATIAEQKAKAQAQQQKLDDIRGQVKGAPKSFAELMRARTQRLYEQEKPVTPEQQAAGIMEWAQIRPQLSALEQEAGMPLSNQPYMQGGTVYTSMVQQIPNVAIDIMKGATTPEEAMQDINDDADLSDQEKWALRQQLREYLGPLGKAPTPFTGKEAKAPPPSAATFRGTSPLSSAIIRQGVGNGR